MRSILYIDCHDLGTSLGCCGSGYASTPNIDRIAQEGAVFTGHFAACPICGPSRAAMHYGRYPHRMNIYGNSTYPPAGDPPSLAKTFRAAGYRTALIGSWKTNGDAFSAGYGTAVPLPHDGERMERDLAEATGGGRRPFFVHLSFDLVHRPFGLDHDPNLAASLELPSYIPDTMETRADIAALALNIERLDALVGKALAVLERASLLDGTVVVFTADHGIAVGRAKHTLYDPGLRTAFIVRAPGLVGSGLRPGCLVSNVDDYPTLCGLAGVQAPGGLDGASFAAAFADPDFRGRNSVFSSFTYGQRSGMQYYSPARSLRSGRFKYIRNFTDIPYYLDTDWLARFFHDRSAIASNPLYGNASPPEEFYDLNVDPDERCNLLVPAQILAADASAALAGMRTELGRILAEGEDEIIAGSVKSKKDSPVVQQWVRPEGREGYVLRYDMFSETAERPFP